MTDAPELKPCPFCGAAPHRMLSKVKHDQLHGDAYQDTIIRCPHRCAEMEGSLDAVAERWNTRADLSQAAVEALEAKLARAVEALSGVMVGGNHLATILPDIVPSAETEPLIALEEMGYGYRYEAWCCWRSIMLARTTLAELTGGKDD